MILEEHADKWIPEPNTGCYIWTAAGDGERSRPVVSVGGNKISIVSRLVCEETYGPAPADKPLALHNTPLALHNTPNGCIGGLCVNGAHLRWATAHENHMDVPPEVRSERVRKGALGLSVEFKKERARRCNVARWGNKQ